MVSKILHGGNMNIEAYNRLAAETIALRAERGELRRRIAELESETAFYKRRIATMERVREMEERWRNEEMQGVAV